MSNLQEKNLKPRYMVEDEESDWLDTYKEVIKINDKYDYTKKKLIFPDFNFSKTGSINYIEEMKKRYSFLCDNAQFLLMPLVRDDEGYRIRKEVYKKTDIPFYEQHQLYLAYDIYLSVLLEIFLLDDIPLEESCLYKKVMSLKVDPKYLEKVKNGAILVKDGTMKDDITNIDVAVFNLLKRVRGFIEGQNNSLNKEKKLSVLDEYFKILRYRNDGKEWKSGFDFEFLDMETNDVTVDWFKDKELEVIPISGRGVGNSKFINNFYGKRGFGSNGSSSIHLSEKDKQELYLKHHDELPWDLEIECIMEDLDKTSINDTRFVRPRDTKPCGQSFNIEEGRIFVSNRGFYHLCNNCGFIVLVPNKLLSDGMKERIKMRCSKDKNLFRKMELISELQALDDKSLPRHKILFK